MNFMERSCSANNKNVGFLYIRWALVSLIARCYLKTKYLVCGKVSDERMVK